MRDLELGRVVRALRRRHGWRQSDCAARAGLHRSTWSSLERGRVDGLTFRTMRRCLAVLEADLEVSARWRGAELARLLDEDHAALQAAWADRLLRWGYDVRVEVSFNHYGDRGRIDLLAWHARWQVLVIGEVKSQLVDAQGLLGPLDVKVRVAPGLVARLGWTRPRIAVPLLVIRDSSTVRDRLRRLEPLFVSFPDRGRRALSRLRHPATISGPLLILSDLRTAADSSVMRVGGQRVRRKAPSASVRERELAPPAARRPT